MRYEIIFWSRRTRNLSPHSRCGCWNYSNKEETKDQKNGIEKGSKPRMIKVKDPSGLEHRVAL